MVLRQDEGGGGVPKLIVELADYTAGEGPAPDDLFAGQVIEKFGWTLDEFNAADEVPVSRMMTALNLVRSYGRVLNAVQHHRTEGLSAADWRVYQAVQRAIKETEKNDE